MARQALKDRRLLVIITDDQYLKIILLGDMLIVKGGQEQSKVKGFQQPRNLQSYLVAYENMFNDILW